MPALNQPLILLIAGQPEVRELEILLLDSMGLRVETAPEGSDPVVIAAQTQPDLIVIHVEAPEPRRLSLIDRLHADSATRAIPVVAITTSEMIAAQAQAAPNVPVSIVAPYDIEAFETAVTRALRLPSPAATLPAVGRPIPGYVAFAADQLIPQIRAVCLQTARALLHTEPYRSRFAELTPGLIDNLGLIVGGIIDGLRRGLAPEQVFNVPEIDRAIIGHAGLRYRQGVGIASVLQEEAQLQIEIDHALHRLIGQHGFTAADAFRVSEMIHTFIDRLAERAGAAYRAAATAKGKGGT